MEEHEVKGLLPMLQENKKNRLTRMNTIVALVLLKGFNFSEKKTWRL